MEAQVRAELAWSQWKRDHNGEETSGVALSLPNLPRSKNAEARALGVKFEPPANSTQKWSVYVPAHTNLRPFVVNGWL